jgi:hypothetical protein
MHTLRFIFLFSGSKIVMHDLRKPSETLCSYAGFLLGKKNNTIFKPIFCDNGKGLLVSGKFLLSQIFLVPIINFLGPASFLLTLFDTDDGKIISQGSIRENAQLLTLCGTENKVENTISDRNQMLVVASPSSLTFFSPVFANGDVSAFVEEAPVTRGSLIDVAQGDAIESLLHS